jgi:hypothetical protein
LPEQGQVDAFVPPYEPRQVLDPRDPVSIGAMVGPEAFTEVRYLAFERMRQALDVIPVVAADFRESFGRDSGTGSCLEVFSTPFPQTTWQVAWLHSLFGNAPAVASGVAAARKAMGQNDIRVVGQGGDGGTVDIGMACLSGMFGRNDDVLYICYDNQGYMNTGVQRSGATPPAARTATTPAVGVAAAPGRGRLAAHAGPPGRRLRREHGHGRRADRADLAVLDGVPGVTFSGGTVDVGPDLMTGHPGIFAGGDMVPAERTVTVAIGHGKKAALRTSTFDEVTGGLDASTAVFEARRCTLHLPRPPSLAGEPPPNPRALQPPAKPRCGATKSTTTTARAAASASPSAPAERSPWCRSRPEADGSPDRSGRAVAGRPPT